MAAFPLIHPVAQADEILLVDADPRAAQIAAALRQTARVATTPDAEVAKQYVVRSAPSLVIASVRVIDETAVTLCRLAKALNPPATVLMTVADVKAVPPLLEAGCDAVLLEPFAPNLLFSRVGRLLRARANGDGAGATTNRQVPDMPCPECARQGAVSFEYTSHRRAWYTCLECKSVWMAKRRE